VLAKLGYSVGFLIVILGRQQLFTENTLKPVLPLLERRDLPTAWQLIRLWTVVLAANLGGAWLFALSALYVDAFPPAMQISFREISEGHLSGGFMATTFSAIYAGWLIALMMWLLPFAETGRIAVIVVLAYVIGLGEFPHLIAGSVPALFEAMSGSAPLRRYMSEFLAPVLLGNVIGGVALVAVINYAQVATYLRRGLLGSGRRGAP
jgi:formate/nitrite transporter FocA (FNT family)